MTEENLIESLNRLKNEYDTIAKKLCDIKQGKGDTLSTNDHSNLNKIKEHEETIKKIMEENSMHIKEIDFLKDLVRRLNEQLNRYVGFQGSIPDLPPNELYKDKRKFNRQGIFKLHSLLTAYDEVINEQNTTLDHMKQQYEEAMGNMRVLQEENENALKYIEIINSEGIGEGQLKSVAADARLLLDERELLIKEISLFQQRERQIKLEYEKNEKKLDCLLKGAESKENSLRQELIVQNTKIFDLHKENEFLKSELNSSVKEEEHKKIVNHCERLLEKLKKVHKEESLHMKNRVHQLKLEQEQFLEKMSDSSNLFKVIKKEAFGYKIHLRKHQSKLSQQTEIIKSLKKHRKKLENYIRNLANMLSQLLQDRNSMLQMVQKYKHEAKKKTIAAQIHSKNLGKLSFKIKDDNFRWSQKVAALEGRMLTAEEAWQRSLEDSARLRKLLQQKDEDVKLYLDNFYQRPL